MPSLIIRLRSDHLEELQAHWPTSVAPSRRSANAGEVAAPDDEDTFFDPSGRLDQFVLRCIGTVTELEHHQDEGGHILLEYDDGSLRELQIDTRQDGQRLPPRSRAQSRQRIVDRLRRQRAKGPRT
jgi:hypothetical protein